MSLKWDFYQKLCGPLPPAFPKKRISWTTGIDWRLKELRGQCKELRRIFIKISVFTLMQEEPARWPTIWRFPWRESYWPYPHLRKAFVLCVNCGRDTMSMRTVSFETVCTPFFDSNLWETTVMETGIYSAVNTIWVLAAARHSSFSCRRALPWWRPGFTRAKNAGNIIMKNLMDFCIGTPVYWLVGFGMMFGASGLLFGCFDPMIREATTARSCPAGVPLWAFVIFQTVFCATAATIVSGAMAERTKFSAYCIYSVAHQRC